MLPKHVESEILQLLKVENHGFIIRRKIDPVGPETLVKRAELEKELAVDQWTLDAIDFSALDSSESRI